MRTSNTILNRSGNSGHSYLVLILEKKLSVFHREYVSPCGFVINDFYYIEICSLCIHITESFYHEWMFEFYHEWMLVSNAFSVSVENEYMIVAFPFVNVVYHIDW